MEYCHVSLLETLFNMLYYSQRTKKMSSSVLRELMSGGI
jgi:hypothetical protein